ncbi:histidine phosphatase family protein [Paenibacillus radicis (ex Xue et al. 2023)]|uniref:Histidine phosphatase family protein n=1 Tax=Paenibacillus radicis (ex Xue et al. 2023) TaxID=2972489 RepID=A0ABT1YP29_9BACL|nr:histidine phosphatase family protein [Paenibacillus radicis (ex Xue et al. 2023)]MCR8634929.1 histidine phosphatase family protein [Paenibacillus radicis (ex Xue et al. 2023)]
MKIGLVRHFRVLKQLPEKRWISPEELTRWFDEYDTCDIEIGQTDLSSVEWKRCYSSDLPRAAATAQTIFNGEIIFMKDLREIHYPLFSKMINQPLPFMLWAILIRTAWFINHKCLTENKADVQSRINAALDHILKPEFEEDVLIVSHGALMMNMRKELIRRGFSGPKFSTPENGKLYLFEK